MRARDLPKAVQKVWQNLDGLREKIAHYNDLYASYAVVLDHPEVEDYQLYVNLCKRLKQYVFRIKRQINFLAAEAALKEVRKRWRETRCELEAIVSNLRAQVANKLDKEPEFKYWLQELSEKIQIADILSYRAKGALCPKGKLIKHPRRWLEKHRDVYTSLLGVRTSGGKTIYDWKNGVVQDFLAMLPTPKVTNTESYDLSNDFQEDLEDE